MSINNSMFGIDSIIPYNLKTGLPISKTPFKVVGSFATNVTQEIIDLMGGSSFDAFDTELGARTFEGTMLLRQYPDALIEIATGVTPTDNAAEANGSVSALLNVNGVSVSDATIGIDSVALTLAAEADVKYARIVVKAVSPTTVDVYASSDVDFAQGTDAAFIAGSQKINATPLTITNGGTTAVAGFGIEFIGGSAVDFNVDDTASFVSKPANSGSREVNIGSPLATPKSIGLLAYTQRTSEGSMYELNIYSALVAGLPINLTEKAFSEAELTFKAKRATNIFTGQEGLFSVNQINSNSI